MASHYQPLPSGLYLGIVLIKNLRSIRALFRDKGDKLIGIEIEIWVGYTTELIGPKMAWRNLGEGPSFIHSTVPSRMCDASGGKYTHNSRCVRLTWEDVMASHFPASSAILAPQSKLELAWPKCSPPHNLHLSIHIHTTVLSLLSPPSQSRIFQHLSKKQQTSTPPITAYQRHATAARCRAGNLGSEAEKARVGPQGTTSGSGTDEESHRKPRGPGETPQSRQPE